MADNTGRDDYTPTERAITEHFKSLSKAAGGGTSKAATPKPKGTSTPRKPTAPKTSKSSAKRKRAHKSSDEDEPMMDDEDDSDAERKMLKRTPSTPRSTLSRRSKSVAKSYAADESSEDDADADDVVDTATALGNAREEDDIATPAAFDGAADSAQLDQGVRQMSVADADDAAEGVNLTPQDKAIEGTQRKSPTKRVKREVIDVGDSDVSEFNPDF